MDQKMIDKILNIGISLSAERDSKKLLSFIIDCAMEITNCDGGTLYLCKEDKLEFSVMKNRSMNIDKNPDDASEFPSVDYIESNVCAYSAIHKEFLNIKDVYECTLFDFQGPEKYDAMTGYRTQSMLVYPLINHENIIVGVVQLINALDESGNVCEFPEKYNIVLKAIGSQAAVAVSNMRYVREIENLMISMTKSFTDAIDKRVPYNYYHSRNVYAYTGLCIDEINQLHEQGKTEIYFDENHKKEMLLSALMHDIGKIVVPAEILNKQTRLEGKLKHIMDRFQLFTAYYKIDYLENRMSKHEYIGKVMDIEFARGKVNEINRLNELNKDDSEYIEKLKNMRYNYPDGKSEPYITEDEYECLSIKHGNITEAERKIISSHVEYSEKYLARMEFGKRYCDIPKWAGQHHEYLDGSGYPRRLTAKDIPIESRILAAVDIYEALTSPDRPYKESIDINKAIEILESMADAGKLDAFVVSVLKDVVKVHPDLKDMDLYYY